MWTRSARALVRNLFADAGVRSAAPPLPRARPGAYPTGTDEAVRLPVTVTLLTVAALTPMHDMLDWETTTPRWRRWLGRTIGRRPGCRMISCWRRGSVRSP
ncbi:MAG: hypothetical protein KFH98_03090, partial [Gemmatimonadetes bacterium]|nr:hypothetical protein [Gemmatimonadota bacterium]